MGDLTPDIDLRPQIEAFEQHSLTNYPQTDHESLHYNIKGVYARAVFIPAGQFVTGKIHNHESIGILAEGTMRVTNGSTSTVITAPFIGIEKAGIKRMAYTETDCTFITVHRTDKTNVSEIEDELVCDTLDEYNQKRLEAKT